VEIRGVQKHTYTKNKCNKIELANIKCNLKKKKHNLMNIEEEKKFQKKEK
jgi:hypothetical protein